MVLILIQIHQCCCNIKMNDWITITSITITTITTTRTAPTTTTMCRCQQWVIIWIPIQQQHQVTLVLNQIIPIVPIVQMVPVSQSSQIPLFSFSECLTRIQGCTRNIWMFIICWCFRPNLFRLSRGSMICLNKVSMVLALLFALSYVYMMDAASMLSNISRTSITQNMKINQEATIPNPQ